MIYLIAILVGIIVGTIGATNKWPAWAPPSLAFVVMFALALVVAA